MNRETHSEEDLDEALGAICVVLIFTAIFVYGMTLAGVDALPSLLIAIGIRGLSDHA